MQYTKQDAIRTVVTCAENYEKELNNRNLLFVCMDKHKRISYFEVSFHDYNYMHLTGLRMIKGENDSEISAEEGEGSNSSTASSIFYSRCLAHKLSPNDFVFSDSSTTPMKLEVLPFILNKNLSANMVGDFHSSKPKLYTEKLAGGVKACVGFVKNSADGEYVPNTVLKEDLRNNVANFVRIIVTYRKNSTDEAYSEIVYSAKKIDWSSIIFPDEFSYLRKPSEG